MVFSKFSDITNYIKEYGYTCDYASSYFAVSNIGSLLNKGMRSPVDCGSFGKSKILAVKKAYSESLERRSMVAIPNKDKLAVIDLLQDEIVHIKTEHFYFSKSELTDTTASAVNPNGKIAVRDALLEIIEKNATLLFWYKKDGIKIELDKFDYILKKIIPPWYSYQVYLTYSFYPIIVSFTLLYIDNLLAIIGTGAGNSIKSSITKSANEAVFLSFIDEGEKPIRKLLNIKVDKYSKKKFESLNSRETYKYLQSFKIKEIGETVNISSNLDDAIKNSLSKYTSHMYLHVQKSMSKNVLIAKVFSPDLINYVPFKSNLEFDKRIYKNLIHDKKYILENIPELPIM